MRALVAAILLLPAIGSASHAGAQYKPDKEERVAMAMSPEEVSLRLELKGQSDALEPAIWISTQPFLRGRSGGDKFLRANIDKITGKVFYQLYLSSSFSQSLRFDRMTYLVGGKLKTAKVERIYFDVSCQRYGCTHFEDFVVDLSREDLQALAAEGGGPYWRARLFGQSVEGADVDVLRNETSGLLLAVDQQLARLQPSERAE